MLSRNLEKTLRRALALANARQHEYATLEHLLMALTDDDDAVAVLKACAVEIERLRGSLNEFLDHELTGLAIDGVVDAKPVASFQRVIQRAAIHVQSSGRSEVNGANVLVGLFSERESHAVFFLQEQNMSRLDAVNYISHGIARRPGMTERRRVRGGEEPEDWSIAQSGAARTLYGAHLEQLLVRALALANARRHAYATLDHLLLALTDDQSAATVLKACAIDVDRLRATLGDGLDHKLSRPAADETVDAKPTVGVQRVMLQAAIDARKSQSSEATGTTALMALFSERAVEVGQGRLEGSYRVSLLNDDDTPSEFVTEVLERLFGLGRGDAARIMLQVHSDGVGVCGVYPFEIAETKVSEVVDYARQHHHPLRLTMARD